MVTKWAEANTQVATMAMVVPRAGTSKFRKDRLITTTLMTLMVNKAPTNVPSRYIITRREPS